MSMFFGDKDEEAKNGMERCPFHHSEHPKEYKCLSCTAGLPWLPKTRPLTAGEDDGNYESVVEQRESEDPCDGCVSAKTGQGCHECCHNYGSMYVKEKP